MTFAKQYKAVSPTATVQRIKRLLSDVGVKVKEETRSLKDLVYSTRITITNGRIEGLGLGSNGKGVSPEYALASGYAELMERLQTRLLYDDMLMLPPSATKKFLWTIWVESSLWICSNPSMRKSTRRNLVWNL